MFPGGDVSSARAHKQIESHTPLLWGHQVNVLDTFCHPSWYYSTSLTAMIPAVRSFNWLLCFMFHQQEEKDRETPKDSLDDLFPNDEEEHGQGSKKKSIQQSFYLFIKKSVDECCRLDNKITQESHFSPDCHVSPGPWLIHCSLLLNTVWSIPTMSSFPEVTLFCAFRWI